MTAIVTDQMQVSLPREVCDALGIGPGAHLDLNVRDGVLHAVKVQEDIYSPERIAEEAILQKGCSTEVPEDFPQ